MKHLKPFFESVSLQRKRLLTSSINVGELKDFVNNSHFAYLVDEGFTFDVFSYHVNSRINGTLLNDYQYFDSFSLIRIVKIERGSKVLFNWNDIKDSFTSFLESFIRRYDLPRLKLEFGVETHGVSGVTTYNVSDVMEDRIKSDWSIKYIAIKK